LQQSLDTLSNYPVIIKDGAEPEVLAAWVVSVVNAHSNDKSNDGKGGDNNDGDEQDDNRRSHDVHNDDGDGVVRVDVAAPGQSQKILLTGKEI
jgi:hypothetical protein